MRIELEERLRAWVDAGLVSPEQAAAIQRHEGGRDDPGGDAPSVDASPRRRISLAAEAVGYLGAAFVLTAAMLLLGELWPTLTDGGRVALAAIGTVVVGGAGLPLRDRQEPALGRFAALLLAGGVVGAGTTVGLAVDLAGGEDALAVLLGGLAAAAAGHVAWRWHGTWLQHTVLLGALVVASQALLALVTPFDDPVLVGIVLVSTGVAWSALAWVDLTPPGRTGDVLGGILVLAGAQAIAFDQTVLGTSLGIAAGAALLGRAVVTSSTPLLVVGTAGVVVLLPQVVFELFADTLGAPLTLLVVGLLLVLTAAGVVRVRAEVADDDGRAGPGGRGDDDDGAEPDDGGTRASGSSPDRSTEVV